MKKQLSPAALRGRRSERAEELPRLLARMRQIATEAGFQCLAERWETEDTFYPFSCLAAGHRIERRGGSVMAGLAACAACRKAQQYAQLRAYVAERGGELLIASLGKLSAPVPVRCAAGHEWQTSLGKLLDKKSWCRVCFGLDKRRADGFATLLACVERAGGRMLTTEYATLRGKYHVACANGHQWETTGDALLAGRWCRACAFERQAERMTLADGLAQLQAKASARGGVCLATEYSGGLHRYEFRCGAGHEWLARGKDILRDRWCPTCAIDDLRFTIAMMRETAQARGGDCLSDAYVDVETKLEWRCHRGHVWRSRPRVVLGGSWCPQCAILERCTSARSRAREKYETVGRLE